MKAKKKPIFYKNRPCYDLSMYTTLKSYFLPVYIYCLLAHFLVCVMHFLMSDEGITAKKPPGSLEKERKTETKGNWNCFPLRPISLKQQAYCVKDVHSAPSKTQRWPDKKSTNHWALQWCKQFFFTSNWTFESSSLKWPITEFYYLSCK